MNRVFRQFIRSRNSPCSFIMVGTAFGSVKNIGLKFIDIKGKLVVCNITYRQAHKLGRLLLHVLKTKKEYKDGGPFDFERLNFHKKYSRRKEK